MATDAGNKGAIYQYYWIKVATRQQMADYQKTMLARGGPAPASGIAQVDSEPNTGSVVPGPPKKVVSTAAQPHTGVTGSKDGSDPPTQAERAASLPLRKLLEPDPTSPGNATKGPPSTAPEDDTHEAFARVTFGYLIAPEYANRKGMTVERRAMMPGRTREEVEGWIDTEEGREWAGDAFCFLAYVAVTAE